MPRAHRLYLLISIVAFLLTAWVGSEAQTVSDRPLTNAGVSKMVKAGLPESVVLRVIQLSRTNFDTSPAGLIELRKHGASETVLNAVLDSWAGGGMPFAASIAEDTPGPGTFRPSGHLPSFQAKLRVNRKTHEQLMMRPNHIELKGTGVPSVSVEWQGNP